MIAYYTCTCNIVCVILQFADYAAYRNEYNGSYFIQLFCEVMSERAHREHFLEIITEVTLS